MLKYRNGWRRILVTGIFLKAVRLNFLVFYPAVPLGPRLKPDNSQIE
jgi:hypothetical protein